MLYNLPYRNGLKKQSGIPLFWDSETKIDINSNLNIFINYFESEKRVKYDLNGGITYNNQNTINTDCFLYSDDNYLFSSTINLSQYVYKTGYVLESLNTKADGSGVRIGVGSRISNSLFVSNELTLFAIWEKETNANFFEYYEDERGATITKYLGDDQKVVIPRFIIGKAVIRIASNSFVNNVVTEKIVFPDTIVDVENFAFVNYSEVKELVIYSSIEIISKNSFDMPKLKNIE